MTLLGRTVYASKGDTLKRGNMREFTIFKRLALGYLAILLVVVALGIYTTLKLNQLNHIILSISSIDGEIIRIANRLRGTILSQRAFEKKYIVSKDKDFHRQFSETEKYIEKDIRQIDLLMDTPEKKRLIADAKELHSQYLAVVQKEVRLIKAGKGNLPKGYQGEKWNLVNHMTNKLAKVVETAKGDMNRKIGTSGEIGARASKVATIITVAAIIMAILIAFFNARTINRPILLLIEGTRKIAKGKFEEHLTIPSPPEIKELANAFNLMCDRLKEIDEIKADLISNISHELRTPLAVTREAVSLLLSGVSAGSVAKDRKLLRIIEEECERLIHSVNRILDLSRMDAGMMDYHPEKHSLSPLIERNVSKIMPIAQRNGISLEVYLDGNLPPANIDGERIGQVMDNLLENALKFTPEGGRVVITAILKNGKTSGPLSSQGNELIEISVSDTGCGIPDENLAEIFNKFKKLHGRGTGLGLHIAKHVVNAYGGSICVESESGKGSTFSFTVPAC